MAPARAALETLKLCTCSSYNDIGNEVIQSTEINQIPLNARTQASATSPFAPCWRSPMWTSQAEAEGLPLLKADNTTAEEAALCVARSAEGRAAAQKAAAAPPPLTCDERGGGNGGGGGGGGAVGGGGGRG